MKFEFKTIGVIENSVFNFLYLNILDQLSSRSIINKKTQL